MFGNVRRAFGTILKNLLKSSGSCRKSSENYQKRGQQYVYVKKEHYTLARRYKFYVLVARTISHSFAALTDEIVFLPLEHKIHIFSPPCNILYIFLIKLPWPTMKTDLTWKVWVFWKTGRLQEVVATGGSTL